MAGRTINFFLDMGATYSRLSFSGILSLKSYQIVGVEGGLLLGRNSILSLISSCALMSQSPSGPGRPPESKSTPDF